MRELKPVLGSIKGCVDDVIDFGFVFDNSVKEMVELFLFGVIFGRRRLIKREVIAFEFFQQGIRFFLEGSKINTKK